MRRVLLPIVLLAVAALSCAAVFAIHEIEAPGSPIGTPTVTPYLSPGQPGTNGAAVITFDVRGDKRRRLDVVVTDDKRKTVRKLLTGDRLVGRQKVVWRGVDDDGTTVPDGIYFVTIDLEGYRSFEVRSPIEVDTKPPSVREVELDALRAEKHRLVRVWVRGQADAVERTLELDGQPLEILRVARTDRLRRANSWEDFFISARLPKGTTGGEAARVQLVLVDRAGNELRRSATKISTVPLEPPARRKRT